MSIFISLNTIDAIDNFIADNKLSFFYISQPNCSVCLSLKPQIKNMLQQFPEIATAEVDTEVVPEIAGHFSIFTVPVLLLFVEGKEYIREARIVHTDALHDKISKIYKNRLNHE